MVLPRHCFIDQFAISFVVSCLKLWNERRKDPLEYIPRCFYEQIITTNGGISVTLQEFRPIAWPVVEEFWLKWNRKRPHHGEPLGAYGALSAAGSR
jgi:hypothetical protein